MHEKFQYYNGLKFTKDEKTGYYLNSTLRIRMHRYVWVCNNGDIPEGYDVHHIDGDRGNNDISNLELLTKKEHRQKHWDEMPDEKKQLYIDNMNETARPAAIEWHKSEEGKKWHSMHAKSMIENGQWHKKEKFICEQCGREFEQTLRRGHKFCSGACSQKWLRAKQPIITRTCVVCGKEYNCKQSSLSKTCSKHCSNLLWHHPEQYN